MAAKLTITRAGNCLTLTDGAAIRKTSCASPAAAKALETRLRNNPTMARRWMKTTEPVQLVLPLPTPEPTE